MQDLNSTHGDEPSLLEDPQEALEHLIKSASLIPTWFKHSMQAGLAGKSILSQQEVKKLLSMEPPLGSREELSQAGFELTRENYDRLQQLMSLGSSLIATSLRCHYGWGLPSEEAIATIVQALQGVPGLVEVGAGSGLWSGIISARSDADVVACELNLRSDTPRAKYYPVLNMCGKDALHANPGHALLLVWADTNEMSLQMAQALKPAKLLMLVGPVGVTGTRAFYQYLDENFERQETMENLYVLKKLPSPNLGHDGFFQNLRQSQDPASIMRQSLAKRLGKKTT